MSKYLPGQIVTLKSGKQHRILEVYEHKPERGHRYGTITVTDQGTAYGPFRNITDKTPALSVREG